MIARRITSCHIAVSAAFAATIGPAAADLLWDNGEFEFTGVTVSARNTFHRDAWIVDDLVLPSYAVLRSFEWTCYIRESDFFIPAGCDFILLTDDFKIRRELEDLGYLRQYKGHIFAGRLYRLSLYNLEIPIRAGHYFVGGRPVGHGFGLAGTGMNQTVRGQDEAYFRSAELGYPDWVRHSKVVGEPRDAAFAAYGIYVKLGDLNCDQQVTFGDVNPFILALTDPDEYTRHYPGCTVYNGDCNQDQKVDFGDINPFVELLSGEH